MRYWINTVSHDHVKAGMEGGFTQANHGRATNLRRLSKAISLHSTPRARTSEAVNRYSSLLPSRAWPMRSHIK